MEYKETLDRIKKIMKYQKDLVAVFSKGGVEKLEDALELMEYQLNQLGEDRKVIGSDADRNRVKGAIDLFFGIAVYQPIVPIFRDLSEAYLLLAFNWNKEVGEVAEIATKITAIRNIVRGKTTMDETINLLRAILVRLRKLSQYEPPAFNLSRHYLESLESQEKTQVAENE